MTALLTDIDYIVAQSQITSEETSGVTQEKEIVDLLSPVLHESLSGGTRSHYWIKIKEKNLKKFYG